MQAFVARRGSVAVFVARFVPGLRFVAGPLAGALGLPVPAFLAANLLGAAVYVPVMVGLGYAVGYGLGGYLERLRRTVGSVEHGVLLLALARAAVVLAWRLFRTIRAETPADRPSDPPRASSDPRSARAGGALTATGPYTARTARLYERFRWRGAR